MKLYSICLPCDGPTWANPYDGTRQFGDFDKCPKCGEVMDVWTESGICNEFMRRQWGIHGAVGSPPTRECK